MSKLDENHFLEVGFHAVVEFVINRGVRHYVLDLPDSCSHFFLVRVEVTYNYLGYVLSVVI